MVLLTHARVVVEELTKRHEENMRKLTNGGEPVQLEETEDILLMMELVCDKLEDLGEKS